MNLSGVDSLKSESLRLMSEAGYPISGEVLFEVDEELPFMGYTTERDGKTVIVVSGWSLKTDMSMGLAIHELSHVYRIESKHPSHNNLLHQAVVADVLDGVQLEPYQDEAIYTCINHLQDLYADDISFEVYIKKSQQENLNEFFLGWIHEPVSPVKGPKDAWKNAGLLLSTAFAQANLERHHVTDTDDKVENAVKAFLVSSDVRLQNKYHYFKEYMVNLPSEVIDAIWRKLLAEYLTTFLKLIKLA